MTAVVALTLIHTAISLVGIFAGLGVTLAPTQTEPPFGITQLAVLAAFVVLGFRALRQSRAAATATRAAA